MTARDHLIPIVKCGSHHCYTENADEKQFLGNAASTTFSNFAKE